jgi:hypothetical protein
MFTLIYGLERISGASNQRNYDPEPIRIFKSDPVPFPVGIFGRDMFNPVCDKPLFNFIEFVQ